MSSVNVPYGCAVNFLQAMKDVSSSGPKTYVYHYGWQAKSFSPDNVERDYKKFTVGEIAAFSIGCIDQVYAKHQLIPLKVALFGLKQHLEEKRSCNFFKKIWIIFLSSLYNLYQGLGFKDSLTLVQSTLDYLEAQFNLPIVRAADQVRQIDGTISFTVEEKEFLLEAFSKKNLRCLKEEKNLEMLLINAQAARLKNNHAEQTVEFQRFPGLVFRYDDDNLKSKLSAIQLAQTICKEQKLDRVIVPESVLLGFDYVNEVTNVLVQRKLSPAPLKPTDFSKAELQEMIRQLTIFICKSGFGAIARFEINFHFDKQVEFVFDKMDHYSCSSAKEGLLKRKDYHREGGGAGLIALYPQFADFIIATAKENLPEEQFQALEKDLNLASEKAKKVVKLKSDLEEAYQVKKIDKTTPAIPLDVVDQVAKNEGDKNIWREIINDINTVIRKQGENEDDLALVREWRLTGDYETADSNWKQVIYNHRGRIERELLPKLKELGYVHHVLTREQAVDLDVDFRRILNFNDIIVQF